MIIDNICIPMILVENTKQTIQEYIAEIVGTSNNLDKYTEGKVEAYTDCIKLLDELMEIFRYEKK